MSSCCTLRLNRRRALSKVSPSWTVTSAKNFTSPHRGIAPARTRRALTIINGRGIAAQDLDRALRSFQRLGTETARKVLEFYHLRAQSDAEGGSQAEGAAGTEKAPQWSDEETAAAAAS